METAQESGTYLYAVASGISSPEALGGLTGVRGGKVYTVGDGELTAVVSDVPLQEELRPERRNVQAHQEVLGKATEASRVVLPVAFGTIADNADGIRQLLARYHDDLERQLQRVEGKREMSVRLHYAGPANIFEYVVARDPQLSEARDQVRQAGDAATRDQKIALGQQFEAALEELRNEYAQDLEEALRGDCSEIQRQPPRNEQEVARFACLVDKGQQDAWSAALERAAKTLPDVFTLEQAGPFAPYDFVDLHLQA